MLVGALGGIPGDKTESNFRIASCSGTVKRNCIPRGLMELYVDV